MDQYGLTLVRMGQDEFKCNKNLSEWIAMDQDGISISKIRVFGFRFPNFDFRFSIVVVVTGAVWILNIRAGVMQRFGWD